VHAQTIEVEGSRHALEISMWKPRNYATGLISRLFVADEQFVSQILLGIKLKLSSVGIILHHPRPHNSMKPLAARKSCQKDDEEQEEGDEHAEDLQRERGVGGLAFMASQRFLEMFWKYLTSSPCADSTFSDVSSTFMSILPRGNAYIHL
jgi:hypothetical protein